MQWMNRKDITIEELPSLITTSIAKEIRDLRQRHYSLDSVYAIIATTERWRLVNENLAYNGFLFCEIAANMLGESLTDSIWNIQEDIAHA